VIIRNEEDAVAAYASYLGGKIPEGYYVTATCMVDLGFILPDDSCLWSVGLTSNDEANTITGGVRTILGPDGKVWAFPVSSHERQIIEMALTHLYIEGLSDLVDPDVLEEQLEVITSEKNRAVLALADAARRGELQQVPASPPA
jgi:hypothetical protein